MMPRRNPNPAYVDPAAFITMLSEKMQDNGVYVADVGQNQIWSCGYHIVKEGNSLLPAVWELWGILSPLRWELNWQTGTGR